MSQPLLHESKVCQEGNYRKSLDIHNMESDFEFMRADCNRLLSLSFLDPSNAFTITLLGLS